MFPSRLCSSVFRDEEKKREGIPTIDIPVALKSKYLKHACPEIQVEFNKFIESAKSIVGSHVSDVAEATPKQLKLRALNPATPNKRDSDPDLITLGVGLVPFVFR